MKVNNYNEEYFLSTINDCQIKTDKRFPDMNFYVFDNTVYFVDDFYNKNMRPFSIRKEVWDVVYVNLDFNHQDTSNFFRRMMRKHKNIYKIHPYCVFQKDLIDYEYYLNPESVKIKLKKKIFSLPKKREVLFEKAKKMKYLSKLEQLENKFLELIDDSEIVSTAIYPNSTFFMKNDKIIFEIDRAKLFYIKRESDNKPRFSFYFEESLVSDLYSKNYYNSIANIKTIISRHLKLNDCIISQFKHKENEWIWEFLKKES